MQAARVAAAFAKGVMPASKSVKGSAFYIEMKAKRNICIK
jgi:hypothetical protein